MSPYLASGIVSARMVLNKAKALTNGRLESGRDSGIGMWVQEVRARWLCFGIALMVPSFVV